MSNTIPEGWEVRPIGNLVTLQYGKSPKDVVSKDGLYPVIGTGGITGYASSYLHDGFTTVIGRKGTINKPSYVEGKFWAIDTTYFGTCYKQADPKWFYYNLNSFDLSKYNEASGVPSLGRDTLNAIPLLTPPLPEQQKIAAILSSVDDVIEKARAQIDKLKDLKTGIMQEFLTKGIGPGGVPHTEFKDSPVGKVPVTWEVLEVGDFLSERRTRGLEGLPIYSVLMDGGMVPRDTVDRRVTSGLNASENRLAKKGDLAYNMMRMWQGASGIAPTKCLVSPAYVVCRPSERIHADFLGYLLKSPTVIQLLHRYSQGLTGDRLRLYFDSFKRIKLPIPPLEQQIKIADALSALDGEIDNKQVQLSSRQSLKQAFMQDLLTGKVRVNADQKESAVA